VADLDDPKKAEKKLGNLYTVKANGHEYVYDGTNWVDLSADLDNKLNVLPKVDDPTDPGVGWPYHIPYDFDVVQESDNFKVTLKTLTLDNNVTKMNFDKNLPAATTELAGLMSADDKTKLEGKQDQLTAGDNITIDSNNKISANANSVVVTGESGHLDKDKVLLLDS